MNRKYFSTDAEWDTDASAPDPVLPTSEDDGGDFAIVNTKHLGPFEHGGRIVFRTIWTWVKLEVAPEPVIGNFSEAAPSPADWPAEDGEPGDDKSGRLVRLQASRAGDRVTVELALEFDAERLKSVLPMAHLYANNPGFPEPWRSKILDAAEHIRSTIDGGASHDRH